MSPPCFWRLVANLWMKSWDGKASAGRRAAMAAEWTSPCSRLSEQRPCRLCAGRTTARLEGCPAPGKRGHCPFTTTTHLWRRLFCWRCRRGLLSLHRFVKFLFYVCYFLSRRLKGPPLLSRGINSPGYNEEKRRRFPVDGECSLSLCGDGECCVGMLHRVYSSLKNLRFVGKPTACILFKKLWCSSVKLSTNRC